MFHINCAAGCWISQAERTFCPWLKKWWSSANGFWADHTWHLLDTTRSTILTWSCGLKLKHCRAIWFDFKTHPLPAILCSPQHLRRWICWTPARIPVHKIWRARFGCSEDWGERMLTIVLANTFRKVERMNAGWVQIGWTFAGPASK